RSTTAGGVGTADPAGADWLFPALTAMEAGAAALAVAVNVTGLPVRPAELAVRVSPPVVLPSVQLPTVAMPLPLVVWPAPVMLPVPGPAPTATRTATPGHR